MWKKWHQLTFMDVYWMFLETKQWMWAQRGSGWCVLAMATATWITNHVLGGHAQLSHHKTKRDNQLIHTNWQIITREFCTELNISFSVLETMVTMLEYCKICTRWVPQMFNAGTERTLYASASGPTEPIQGWKWYSPQVHHYLWWDMGSPTMRCSQNSSPWDGYMWIPLEEKVQDTVLSKWSVVQSFEIGKWWSFWISWNTDKPSILTTTSWC